MPDPNDADFVSLVAMMEKQQAEIAALGEEVERLQRDLVLLGKERDLYRKFHQDNLAMANLQAPPIPAMTLSPQEQAAFDARIRAVRDNAQKWRNALQGLKQNAIQGLRQFLAAHAPGV